MERKIVVMALEVEGGGDETMRIVSDLFWHGSIRDAFSSAGLELTGIGTPMTLEDFKKKMGLKGGT